MKIKRILSICLPLAALVLEILPESAVLYFGNPDGEPFRETYSYFSLVPFGYADFGPFITAILTCLLLLLAVIACFKYSRGLNIAIMNVSGFAAAAALLPLMFGVRYMTPVGFIIVLLLAGTFGCCFIKEK